MINAAVIIMTTIVENPTYVVVNNASVSFSIIYQRNSILNIAMVVSDVVSHSLVVPDKRFIVAKYSCSKSFFCNRYYLFAVSFEQLAKWKGIKKIKIFLRFFRIVFQQRLLSKIAVDVVAWEKNHYYNTRVNLLNA